MTAQVKKTAMPGTLLAKKVTVKRLLLGVTITSLLVYFYNRARTNPLQNNKCNPTSLFLETSDAFHISPVVFSQSSNSCIGNGYLTVFDGGRLGNKMCQYATLFAHANRLGAKPVITSHMRDDLIKHFPMISIPVLDQDCHWVDVDYFDIYNLTSRDLKNNNFRIGLYIMDLSAFRFFQHQLVTREFAINDGIINQARNFLTDASKNYLSSLKTKPNTLTLISVHVRRTDYKKWLKDFVEGNLVSSQYIHQAMDTFRNQFKNSTTEVLFVMASDDITWCQEMFSNCSDVVFASNAAEKLGAKQPTFDLAALSLCQHSILSFGTFGFWTAFMKDGGEVIMASSSSRTPYYVEQSVNESLPTWKFMKDPCYAQDENGTYTQLKDCF